MTTQPTPRLDVERRVLSTPLSQFRGKPVFEALLKSHAKQLQEIEIMLWQLLAWRVIDNAAGIQLDKLGSIVGERRENRTDEVFRAAVRTRIRLNRSFATVEEVLGIMRAVALLPYKLIELGNATFELEYPGASTETQAAALNVPLQRVRAGGVAAFMLYHGYAETDVFALATGDADEYDEHLGAADDTSTSGGYAADVL